MPSASSDRPRAAPTSADAVALAIGRAGPARLHHQARRRPGAGLSLRGGGVAAGTPEARLPIAALGVGPAGSAGQAAHPGCRGAQAGGADAQAVALGRDLRLEPRQGDACDPLIEHLPFGGSRKELPVERAASAARVGGQPALRSVEALTGHHAPELGPLHALTIVLA